jgi:hypothetical protein
MHSAPDRRLPTITATQRGLSGNAAGAVQTYITLTGITNVSIIGAINDFVNGLIYDNLWDKIDVMYPFIGGNATAHSINLKDPINYAISTFTGSVVHSINGVSGTASTNSSFTVPFSHASQNANDFSSGYNGRFPSGTGSTSNILYFFNAGTTTMGLDVRSTPLTAGWRMCGGTLTSNVGIGVLGNNGTRFIAFSSNSNTSAYSFVNEFTQVSNLTKGSSATGNSISVSLSSTTTDAPWTYSFWYTGKAFTETEMDKLNKRVQVLNQTLDTIQGSTRANNFYINPNYNRYTNAFISNVGIANLTTTEQDATNYLLNALDTSSTGLMSALTNIFPFVGNSVAVQTKCAKTLASGTTFSTFSATSLGLSPDSNLCRMTPPTAFTWNAAFTIGFYITEEAQSSGYEIAADQTNKYIINVRSASNTLIANFSNTAVSVANTTAKGHYIARSTYNVVSAPYTIFKNGSTLTSGTTSGTGSTTGSTFLFGQGNVSFPSTMRTQGIAYFFNSLYISDAQATEMNTIVQNFISLLSRT